MPAPLMIETSPSSALLRTGDQLPLVDAGDGSRFRLVNADLASGVWTIFMSFAPGTTIPTHYHTGHVHAFTLSGSWYYLEGPDDVNVAGAYLFEPAGSRHTLHVPETNDAETDVWFTIHGANVNLDEDGSVTAVIDAPLMLQFYRSMCEAEFGIVDPPVVVIDAPGRGTNRGVDATSAR